MTQTIAFDVYGTLIDTDGLVERLRKTCGLKAADFSRLWRQKQLEYSFRRALMRRYEPFALCTRDALDYASEFLGICMTAGEKQELLDSYRTLSAFDDVAKGLASLKMSGFQLWAFSNGTAEAVETLLEAAGIREFFLGVVSVHDVHSFKPDPAVYRHFLSTAGTEANSAWLVSGNPFDVTGAVSAGMKAVWVRRSPEAVFDPLGMEPTLTVESLHELDKRIAEYHSR
ncbi:MAG: haloacid dehalogenase type II [Chlorobium sp.]